MSIIYSFHWIVNNSQLYKFDIDWRLYKLGNQNPYFNSDCIQNLINNTNFNRRDKRCHLVNKFNNQEYCITDRLYLKMANKILISIEDIESNYKRCMKDVELYKNCKYLLANSSHFNIERMKTSYNKHNVKHKAGNYWNHQDNSLTYILYKLEFVDHRSSNQ